MSKYLKLAFCIFLVFAITSFGINCKACNSPKSYTSFKKLLESGDSVIEVNKNYDLSFKTIKVRCNKQLKIGNDFFYIDSKPIVLKKGQTIILPHNSIVVDDSHSRILGKGAFEAKSKIHFYIGSKTKDHYECPITEELLMPSSVVLKFTTGSVKNGVINMSGGTIDSSPRLVFRNCVVTQIGNTKIHGKWFFEDGQTVFSEDMERYSDKEINFNNMKLYAQDRISVSNACWRNLSLTAPQIIIGDEKYVIPDFSISKGNTEGKNQVKTEIDLSNYKDYIVILSFGEHVHYDWREVNGRPTLYRGVSTVVKNGGRGYFLVEDSVESFNKEYQYTNAEKKIVNLESTGYLLKPCMVSIDSCQFLSPQRLSPGFMYIYSGKDISLKNSSWLACKDGTPSLLGINYSVNGTVENCYFKGAYYEGTPTSYGLQTFGSTRISINNCIFESNRRGLDFSGSLCQSRYCIVENCKVVGDIIKHTGSGLGGHSTSSHNIYRNNIIEGSSSCAGVQTRGEYEIVEGNVFDLAFSAATVTCAENTIVRNNVCKVPSNTFVWIESSSIKNNQIVVENNTFRGGRLVRGQKVLACDVLIKGNTFEYTSPSSSIAPEGDNVHITIKDNIINKGGDKAVLYYKYNETLARPKAEGMSTGDKVDIKVDRDSKRIVFLQD